MEDVNAYLIQRFGMIAEIDTFTITRRQDKKPDPDCPWR